jgi:TPR repeat protein
MLFEGKGTSQDHLEALKMFTLSAEQGYDKAQVKLGTILIEGKGTPAHKTEGCQWLVKAAEQGNEEASQKLRSLLILVTKP